MATALGRICAACGAERKKKGIKYDPNTLIPYCENPYICNENHPNSPKNLIARGSELKLVSYAEAQELFKKYLELHQPTPERAEKIRRMTTQPSTFRIGDPKLAEFLLNLQEEFKFSSISDTIRYCIELVMENRGRFYADHAKLAEEKAEQERIQKAEQDVQQMLEKNPFAEDEDEEEELTF